MAAEGAQIILYQPARQSVLMFLRDDKPSIPYPNMWSLLGGMLEPGETPAECIVREIEEEIGVKLDPDQVTHYRTRTCSYGIEHTFRAKAEFELEAVTLTEGQRLAWFTAADAATTELGYEDNAILADYFAELADIN